MPITPSPPTTTRSSPPTTWKEKLARLPWWLDPLAQGFIIVVLAAVLARHAAYYWPFFSDDALISLRYARRFADGHGLTWTGGERVEGYSDLLWVLLMSVGRLLRLDLIKTARVTDFIGCVAAIAAVCISPIRPFRIRSTRALTAGLGLALSAPVAVWAIGGLEQGFMTGVLAFAILFLVRGLEVEATRRRDLLVAGALLAALALLRVDGIGLVLAVATGALLSRRPSWQALRDLGLLLAAPLGCIGLQLLFRRYYYGQWVPNTAVVKVAFNEHRLIQGLHHVRDGFKPLLPLLGLVAVSIPLLWGRVPRARWLIPLLVSLAWSAYLTVVGGDIFPGWRQLLLGIVPLFIVVAEAADSTAIRWPRWGWGFTLAAVPLLIFSANLQRKEPENVRAKNEVWEWAGLGVGTDLGIAFRKQQPLLAVDAAGALPYWSDLPSLDMLGLNDRYIATHPPPTFGTGGIGHELGDGVYVMTREPDIIAFDNSVGYRRPDFLSGKQFINKPEFKSNYQLIRLRDRTERKAVGELWIRRESGKIALRRSADRIEVPGYFFAGGDAVAELDGDELVTEVTSTAVAELPSLRIPGGTWRLELDPPSSELDVGFRCAGTSAIRSGQGSGDTIAGGPNVDIVVATRGDDVRIRSATLTRVQEPAAFVCAGTPIRVRLEDLSVPKAENSYWAAPTNIVFHKGSVTVSLPAPTNSMSVEASFDNNDRYKLIFFRDGRKVGEVTADKSPNHGGLAVHDLPVPEEARLQGFDRIDVVPEAGDKNYAIGHLLLRP